MGLYVGESKKLIGFFDLYHGYPSANSLWISMFLLGREFQKKGYGQEIINLIKKEARNVDYNKVGIGVYLKNWSALRFWTKCGFDKVTGIYGDEIYSESSFTLIGLEHDIE